MGMHGRIPDNCYGGCGLSQVFQDFDPEKDRAQWELLRERISGKTLSQLRSENPNLLIFPLEFGSVKDIEKVTVFSVKDETEEEKIVTGNLMGFVGYKGCSLSIASRFYPNGNDYFLHYMLARASGAHIVDFDFGRQNDSVWDFLPYLFPQSMAYAWRQGVYRVNRRMERNDSHVRGTIDVARHIQQNIPFQGNVAYSFSEKTINNPVNRLIRLTIDVLEKDRRYNPLFNSDDKIFLEAVNQIKQNIGASDIANKSKIIKENLRPVSHPLFLRYKALQKLCLAILRHDKLTFGSDSDKIHGILFDGAWLWEEYLSKIMPSGITHSDNRNRKNGVNALRGKWSWYPDFYGKGDLAIVLDAKYKRLDGGKELDEGIGASDQHQIVSYMYILKARYGGFVYPYPINMRQDDVKLQVLGTLAGFGGTVAKIGTPIFTGATTYSNFVECMKKIEEQIREVELKFKESKDAR
ncbi:MAG: hypothetical protein J6P13_03575 [Kiritimatiellae bacterium]|nr:hypothetical protein [Kiritimatiellia bacterium]